MSYRAETNASQDKRIFHTTAQTTKKVNIAPKTMRGGIRF